MVAAVARAPGIGKCTVASQTLGGFGGEVMATRDQILAEVYEQALQNDMRYFG